MKKIFTTLLMALAAMSINAQKQTVWTSESPEGTLLVWGSGAVTINNIDVAAGSVITVTVASVDKTIDAYPQGTMCTPVGDSWDWTELQNQQMQEAGEYEYTITADMLDNINSHKQIFFKGTAAYVTKVEHTPPTSTVRTTIWTSDQATDGTLLEWGKPNVKVENIDVKEGDAIILTASKADTTIDANPQATMRTSVGDEWTWTDLKNLPIAAAGEYKFAITADMLDNINSHKQIFFCGTAVYVTKLELETPVDEQTDKTLLWSNEAGVAVGWNEDLQVSGAKLTAAEAKAGDIIKITITEPTDGHQLFVHSKWKYYGHQGKFLAGQTEYTLGLTSDMLEAFKANGLCAAGSGVKVTEIRLVEGTTIPDEVIWFGGNYQLLEGHDYLQVQGASIPATANTLEVEAEGGGEGAWLRIDNSEWADLQLEKEVDGNIQKFAVTDALRATIGNFIVHGGSYTIKSIKYSTDVLTGISTTTVQPQADGKRYNLAGQQVTEGYKGLVIVNGRKQLVK